MVKKMGRKNLFSDEKAQMHTIEALVAALLMIGAVTFLSMSAPSVRPEFSKVQLQEYGEDTLQVLSVYPSEMEPEWWDDGVSEWDYRIPVKVSANAYDRTDYPIKYYVNFTGKFPDVFDENSTRVIEYYPNGTIKGEVPSQFNRTFKVVETTLNITEGWSYQDDDELPIIGSIGEMTQDDTVKLKEKDDDWAPTTVIPAIEDEYKTGPNASYWDMASVKFDLSDIGYENITKATLWAYVSDTGMILLPVDDFPDHHHYDLYRGEFNTTDEDDSYIGHDSFENYNESWIEHQVPISWIDNDELKLSLRLWDAKVDIIQLKVNYLHTDFNATSNAEGNVYWIMNGTTPAFTDRYYYIYFDNMYNPKDPPSYPSYISDDGKKTGGLWNCSFGNVSFQYNLNAGSGDETFPGINEVKVNGNSIDTWDDTDKSDLADSFTLADPDQGVGTIKKIIDGSIYRKFLLSAMGREEYIEVYNSTDFWKIEYEETPNYNSSLYPGHRYFIVSVDGAGHYGYYDDINVDTGNYVVEDYCWIKSSGDLGLGAIMAEKDWDSLFSAADNNLSFYNDSLISRFYIDDKEVNQDGYYWMHATDSGNRSTSKLADSLRHSPTTSVEAPYVEPLSKLAYYLEMKDWIGLDKEFSPIIPDEIGYNFYITDSSGEVLEDGLAKIERGQPSPEAVTVNRLIYADDPWSTVKNVYEIKLVLWYR